MTSHASITVLKPREELERLWQDASLRDGLDDDTVENVSFVAAPGDRGTEIHVQVRRTPRAGIVGEAAQKLTGRDPLATMKDQLRRFKQLVETGEITRSEAVPEGERLKGKLKQRPAQPLSGPERQKAVA